MNTWTHGGWDRAPEFMKYRSKYFILGVPKENKKTDCIDYKDHLGIF